MPGDFAVDDYGRSDTARAKAARGHQREPVVGGCRAGLDSRLVLDGREQGRGALDVAGGAEADRAGMLALRRQREEMVKRRDAVDAAWRELEAVCDRDQQIG